jgi:hypothetical protein
MFVIGHDALYPGVPGEIKPPFCRRSAESPGGGKTGAPTVSAVAAEREGGSPHRQGTGGLLRRVAPFAPVRCSTFDVGCSTFDFLPFPISPLRPSRCGDRRSCPFRPMRGLNSTAMPRPVATRRSVPNRQPAIPRRNVGWRRTFHTMRNLGTEAHHPSHAANRRGKLTAATAEPRLSRSDSPTPSHGFQPMESRPKNISAA